MIYKCSNAYYFRNLNAIGGIESHLMYMGRKYGKKYSITVFYQTGDNEQIRRLSQLVRCVQIDNNDFVECNVLFCCFNREILNQCKAKKTYLVLHGDYKDMVNRGQLSMTQIPLDDRIDEYLGVSELVCNSWEELTGIKCNNVYEPIVLDKVDKPLMLMSATRLSPEKGWNRMVKLCDVLNENNVNFQWFIYTDTVKEARPNMVFLKPRLDITNKMGGYSAFVQLSDNEGFCLSVVESLMRGTPVIATDLPVLRELGLNEDNSIILPLDMSDIPVERIKKVHDLKFSYKQPKDLWDKYLDTEIIGNEEITVKATHYFKSKGIIDTKLNRVPENGEKWTCTLSRYEQYLKFEERYKVKLVEKI